MVSDYIAQIHGTADLTAILINMVFDYTNKNLVCSVTLSSHYYLFWFVLLFSVLLNLLIINFKRFPYFKVYDFMQLQDMTLFII